ncbi:cysteine proteinase [Hymenopellis radicata]|nr:cysteine proteinase [Hymenopellis radicata]
MPDNTALPSSATSTSSGMPPAAAILKHSSLAHFQASGRPLDPDLATHLGAFGINVQTQTKTEKSMTELQIEQNLNYDFSLTGNDGKALQPVFEPGLTGLGNSCYMASVLQTRFSLPAFQERYYVVTKNHGMACDEQLPADCVGCQIIDAQSCRRTVERAAGIKPTGFKALIGKGHKEFSTMRQQDSEEFLTHLLTVLRRDAHKHKERADPVWSRGCSVASAKRCNIAWTAWMLLVCLYR